ncbi:hypothetical protein BV20DRAFT_366618 [Pilatotrama ljubarskyi]|nr:hypothetical protein BV20DRAFT_366618 [Pilatotrama ljubarskyi]
MPYATLPRLAGSTSCLHVSPNDTLALSAAYRRPTFTRVPALAAASVPGTCSERSVVSMSLSLSTYACGWRCRRLRSMGGRLHGCVHTILRTERARRFDLLYFPRSLLPSRIPVMGLPPLHP